LTVQTSGPYAGRKERTAYHPNNVPYPTATTRRGERPGTTKENPMQQTATQDPDTALQSLEQSSEPLLRWLVDLKVTGPVTQKNAEDLLISARAAWKQADQKRKELTRPLDEAKSRIIQLFQPYLNRLETGINILNRELTDYHQALEDLQRREQHKALEEQAARMREAATTGEVPQPIDAPSVPDVPKTSHAHMGTVTYRNGLDIQVVDAAKVPRDLCEPSMPRIRARVKSGVMDIPGVLITPRNTTVARKGGSQ
jgi:hypothetical protein